MNKCMFTGRLTKDIELQQTQSGKSYAKFSLAVQREFNKEEVDFLNFTIWNKQAETLAQYAKKGQMLLISSARAEISEYEDKEGNKRRNTDFIINSFEFLGSSNKEEKKEFTPKPTVEEEDDFPF